MHSCIASAYSQWRRLSEMQGKIRCRGILINVLPRTCLHQNYVQKSDGPACEDRFYAYHSTFERVCQGGGKNLRGDPFFKKQFPRAAAVRSTAVAAPSPLGQRAGRFLFPSLYEPLFFCPFYIQHPQRMLRTIIVYMHKAAPHKVRLTALCGAAITKERRSL